MSSAATVAATGSYPTRARVEGLASRYRLALPERQRGARAGELLGRRTGSSVEFQDRKDYSPGDDLRSVDWRAFARTDRLTVKLYREEITPTVDIIVDTSLSMAVTEAKRLRRMELAHLFAVLGSKLHAMVKLHDLGRRMAPLMSPLSLTTMEDVEQIDPIPPLKASAAARRGGIKVLVSDLLFPFSPRDLSSAFAAADRLIIIQVLASFEADPGEGGALVRLEDAEAPQHLDVRLDTDTVRKYKARLGALQADLGRRVRGGGGAFAVVRDENDLDEVARVLVQAGVLTA